MPDAHKEVMMKKSFMFIVLSVFLVLAVTSVSAEEDDYQKGLRYYQRHQYKASIKHLKAYTEKIPDPRAYYLIAYASYKLKDYAAAKNFFSDVYLIDPAFKASSIDVP